MWLFQCSGAKLTQTLFAVEVVVVHLGSQVGVTSCALSLAGEIIRILLRLSGSCGVREGCRWDKPIQRVGTKAFLIGETWVQCTSAGSLRLATQARPKARDGPSTSAAHQRQGREGGAKSIRNGLLATLRLE